jgi:choline dehydrogenase
VERGHQRCNGVETEGVLGAAPTGLTRQDNRRVSTNDAYLEPTCGRSNLEIRGDVLFDRVLVENGRATGVQTSDGNVTARHVSISAGTIHTQLSSFARASAACAPPLGGTCGAFHGDGQSDG